MPSKLQWCIMFLTDFSVSSSIFLTAFLLPVLVSAEPCQTILSIDRSEPRFESHTEGKITKTSKNDEILMVFVNFHLNQIHNCSVQIKKMKDEIFSFQLKKNLLLPNVYRLDLKMYPLPLI